MTETFLERLVAATRSDLEERQTRIPLDELRARSADAPAPRAFEAALRPATGGHARLIAEVKRASPSKGLLAERFDPVARARAYAAGGATAISVLTEPHFFRGSLEHLTAVRHTVDVPVLRKDFLLDPYQVYEARAAGADAVLLICALLDDAALADLMAVVHALGMEALVEAHDAGEVRRAVTAGARVIGVNSRDLRTFAVDPDVVSHLRPLVPSDRVFVAESGIADARGAARARAWGADTVLVGEALMRVEEPTPLVNALANAGGGALTVFFAGRPHPFVKLCSLREPEHARVAVAAGADAFGLIFAPARRQVNEAQAVEIVRAARDTGRVAGAAARPLAVGVFVNEATEEISRVAVAVGLDAIQLSGDESPAACATVAETTNLPVIKAVRLGSEADLSTLDAYALAGAIPLLDPPSHAGYGGNGETGNWELAHQAARRWPALLAGGLTPENVGSALVAVRPRGVDVSSGTESAGVKDPARMHSFVAAARGAVPTY